MKTAKSKKYYVSKQNASSNEPMTKKQKLLSAGLTLFATKGLTGTTIRDIAQLAQVNSSMISYHYKNKEGLYRACLNDIKNNKLAFIKMTLTKPTSAKDYKNKLEQFAHEFIEIFSKDKYSGMLLIREYDRTQSPASDILKQIFLTTFDHIIDFFKGAKKAQLVSAQKDEHMLASFCLGILFSQMRLDFMKNKIYKKSLSQKQQRKVFMSHFISTF